MECPFCGSKNFTKLTIKNFYWCKECTQCFKYDQLELHDSRKELIKALAEEYEYTCITKQDIIDEIIDIELYNQKIFNCRKNKKLLEGKQKVGGEIS